MAEIYYSIAGTRIRVCLPDGWMYRDHGYLTPFLTEPGEGDRKLEFVPVSRLSPEQGICLFRKPDRQVFADGGSLITYVGAVAESLDGAYLRVCRTGSHSRVEMLVSEFPRGLTPGVVMTAMEMEDLVSKNRGFLLHASFVRWQDRAILFTAPSGTGKSTQADLWCRHQGAELINGDRAIVRLDGDTVLACGVPFCDSSGVTKNVSLPLAAIVYLTQAPENRVTVLAGFEAFRRVWEGCNVNVWNREELSAASEYVLEALSRVPVYRLDCRPEPAAVDALRQVLEGGE